MNNRTRIGTLPRMLSLLVCTALVFSTASIAAAQDLPNPEDGAMTTEEDTALTFELPDDADIVGTGDGDGNYPTNQAGTIAPQPDDTYIYTPDAGFVGNDEFVYETCILDINLIEICTDHTATIEVTAKEDPNAVDLEIKGPSDGSTHVLNEEDDALVVYGNGPRFSSIKIVVNGEESSFTTDGKGQWTHNLTFGPDDAGEHTILVEDLNGNTEEITVTIQWEAAPEEDTDEPPMLEGEDPDVAQTGGRMGSCTSFGSISGSTGWGVLSVLVGLAFIRRRNAVRS